MYPDKSVLYAFILLFVPGICLAQSTDEFNLDKVYAIDSGGTVSLQSDDANVTITGSNREDVRVVVNYRLRVKGFSFGQKDRFEMIVEEEGGNLRIYEKERDFGNRVVFGSSREEYEITLEVPRGVSLELDGDDENYEITSVDGALDVDADDAEITMSDCRGDNFSFNLDDGKVRMDRGKGSLRMDIDDGDVLILNGEFADVEIESDDSELEIATSLSDEGNYRFDFDDGDLRLQIAGGGGEFDIRHDNADISTDGAFERTLDEEDRSVYNLPGGNAQVRIYSDDGDIDLRII